MGRTVEHWFHPINEQLILKRRDFLTMILLSKKSIRLTSSVANRTGYRLESQLLPKENILCRAGISATTKRPYNECAGKHLYGAGTSATTKLVYITYHQNYFQRAQISATTKTIYIF
ncbi:hypothetical protein Ddye_002460 [Dipteronia dyeriana]|uniref:Uncharacterized protein n=1 Tax=Dipteronia dyeriana TaxID=168575 RepID=A0AAD9XQC2_9ROSI|nr:hypothetical protein Ddye_002460 [Dipteronia dyeriana]